MKHKMQSGFTLVELAIVMTIIGLLIGGILKGQELMENARVTATIAQVKSYEAATTTFRDSYAAMPGDMVSAGNRLPCPASASTNCSMTDNAALGNGIVGSPTWGSSDAYAAAAPASFDPANGTYDAGEETVYFWIHLMLADLITGISTEAVQGAVSPSWNITHPSARLGGGFVVGFADGAELGGTPDSAPSGTVIALVGQPRSNLEPASGQGTVTPARAGQIDRKMDDGNPATGYVQASGLPADAGPPVVEGCVSGTGIGDVAYNEGERLKLCNVVFRIQG